MASIHLSPSTRERLRGWVIQKTPLEMIEQMRRTFHEEEFLTEARQAERPGGMPFEDIIGDIEEMVKRRDRFR